MSALLGLADSLFLDDMDTFSTIKVAMPVDILYFNYKSTIFSQFCWLHNRVSEIEADKGLISRTAERSYETSCSYTKFLRDACKRLGSEQYGGVHQRSWTSMPRSAFA